MAFFINGVQFRQPNNLPKTKVLQVSMWRSINNTLTVDKWSYNEKSEMVWEYDYLTLAQFNTLSTYINNGFWTVACNDTGYTFSFLAWLELLQYDESFAQGKGNIKLKVMEQ